MSDRISLQQFCEEFEVVVDFEPSENCYFLYDPVTDDDELTPCLFDEQALEDWVNENLEELVKKLRHRETVPDEYERLAA